jgi:ubiquitin C-terminal hydrolase
MRELSGPIPSVCNAGIDCSSHDSDNFSYQNLQPKGPNEIEFWLPHPITYQPREIVRSERTSVGPFAFNLLVFPAGNQPGQPSSSKLAIYVEAIEVDEKDPRWIIPCVKFCIMVINLKDFRRSIYHEDSHSFSLAAIDRGWPDLLGQNEMTHESGWLDQRGCLCIRASICLRQADTIRMSGDYDPRKETGFIGLRNHGATCYLNGLLQSYFHLGKFAEIVYGMEPSSSPPIGDESPMRMSLPLALQSVFLKLETSETPVNTIELTRAFGWDSMDSFTQHDVQELARILCDKIEAKLRNTPGDGAIQSLFEGQVESFIECLDIEFKSTKRESFYDVPLNVRDSLGEPVGTIESAIREFTSVEILEGDNAYDAEIHGGKQRARRGIRFMKFPPVLSFQLKRFSFDYERMENVKLYDRLQFGAVLDLGDSRIYDLHSVLVHSGDVYSGHYYAFIRPDTSSRDWFKFDDEQVTRCSEWAAMDDNFGGYDILPFNYCTPIKRQPISRPRIHSAYMLIYIERARSSELLARPSLTEVQGKVMIESKKMEERKRQHEIELMTINVNVVNARRECRSSHKISRDISIVDLASLLVDAGSESTDVALFWWNQSRWTLLAPASVTEVHTPSPRHSHDKIMRPTAPLDKRLSDFPLEGPSVDIILVEGHQFQYWTDASPLRLVVKKSFDIRTHCLDVEDIIAVNVHDKLSLLTGGNEDDFLAFEESTARSLDLSATFGDENVPCGSTVVIQINTIVGAGIVEFPRNHGGDSAPRLDPPEYTVKTYADHRNSINAAVNIDVFLIDSMSRIASDGIYSSGEIIQRPEVSCTRQMDRRWDLRIVVQDIIKGLSLSTADRVDFFLHNPLVAMEGPIATSDDLTKVRNLGYLGEFLGTQQVCAQIFVACIPRNSLCVRFFDSAVQEKQQRFVNLSSLPYHGRKINPTDLIVGSFSEPIRLVEVKKSKIVRLYGPNEKVDLQSACAQTCNYLNEYIRIEAGSSTPPEGQIWIYVSHIDRGSGIHFGYPFVIGVDPSCVTKRLRSMIQHKLELGDQSTPKWRLGIDLGTGGRHVYLKDDDIVVAVAESNGATSMHEHVNLFLEYNHPNSEFMVQHKMSGQQPESHYKALTIR